MSTPNRTYTPSADEVREHAWKTVFRLMKANGIRSWSASVKVFPNVMDFRAWCMARGITEHMVMDAVGWQIETQNRKLAALAAEQRWREDVERICGPIWDKHPDWTIGQCVDHLRATGQLIDVSNPSDQARRFSSIEGNA